MNQEWYNIGAFTFPASWAAIIFSFVITYLFLYIWNKKKSDWYSNVIFYFILVWKLSVIIVDFPTAVAHPITILYFHGGSIGYWLGIGAALLYTFMKKEPPYFVVIAWMSTVLAYEGVFDILHSHFFVGGAQLVLNTLLLGLLIKKLTSNRREVWTFQLLIMFTLVQLLLNSFGGFKLNMTTWTYLTLSIYLLSLIGYFKKMNH